MANQNTHVVTYNNAFRSCCKCLHCGLEMKIEHPISFRGWLAAERMFLKAHKNCPPPDEIDHEDHKEHENPHG